MEQGCMTLRKWRANCPELLSSYPSQPAGTYRVGYLHFSYFSYSYWISALLLAKPRPLVYTGRQVRMPSTSFVYLIHHNPKSHCLYIGEILWWFSAALLPAKLLIQEAWMLQVSWDDPLPDQLQQRWSASLQEAPALL